MTLEEENRLLKLKLDHLQKRYAALKEERRAIANHLDSLNILLNAINHEAFCAAISGKRVRRDSEVIYQKIESLVTSIRGKRD